jgi:hypothetical protein
MGTDGMDPRTAGDRPEEPESLAQLRGDCARMSPRWQHPEATAPSPPAHAGVHGAGPARPAGVHVPERSAHLLDGMSDYGD